MNDVLCVLIGNRYLLVFLVVCCVLSRPESGLARVMEVVLRSRPTRLSQTAKIHVISVECWDVKLTTHLRLAPSLRMSGITDSLE